MKGGRSGWTIARGVERSSGAGPDGRLKRRRSDRELGDAAASKAVVQHLRDTAWAMSEGFVEAFAEAMRSAQRAFNAGDFESAFAGLSPNVEWHSGDWVLDALVLKGRDAVIRLFRAGRDAGDWEVEAQEFFDAGEGRVVVHQRGRSVGRTTRIQGTMDFFQLWEIGADGLVSRVREYDSREEALEAARVSG